MFCIDSPSTDVYFNLAAEEYLLKKKVGNFFMVWQNEPSVVIGKHQSVQAEVDMDFVRQRDIQVARRFSGGGAVYHDAGNVNLTFIETNGRADFNRYMQQTIEMLASVGIIAYSDERLGLYVDKRKISGSAQCVHKDRVMYHCTLLFATDLQVLNASLRGKSEGEELAPGSHTVRAVPSVRSEVTNISDHLHPPLDMKRFRRIIFRYFLDDGTEANRIYHFTPEDSYTIEQLRNEKYIREEWIYKKALT